MTKTELFDAAVLYKIKAQTRLAHCTAWYSSPVHVPELSDSVIVLKSYNTTVAVFCTSLREIYVRDYYSATTSQHVWKFYRKMCEIYGTKILMTFLYPRKDKTLSFCKEPLIRGKFTSAEIEQFIAEDWAQLIDYD